MLLIRVFLSLFLLLVSFNLYASSKVIAPVEPNAALAARWDWALNRAGSAEFKNGFWIVYTFKRLMAENESIGNYGDDQGKPTVMEVLTGTRPPAQKQASTETVQDEAKRILSETERSSEEKVWKDVAVLIQHEHPSRNISRAHMSNMNLRFSFKGLPIIWLGPAESRQSVELLKTLYQKMAATKPREELIGLIALHQNPELVIPFLKGVVTNERITDFRKSAIFWLGQTHEREALKFLLQIVNQSLPADLQKAAVFSISQMQLAEADQALIQLATQKENREARLEAIFWIGQQHFDEAPRILEQIVFQESDEEAQRKAVFAISQLKKQLGIPALGRIASKHNDASIREEAIFWIGQIGAEAEGNMLEKIVHQDPNRSVRKKAVFSISQMKKEISISHLERIAKSHPETEMRKEAIFWLGQIKDPRAKNVLLQILKN